MRIALTGNPNYGKTTMYNAFTGRNEKVGNWAAVAVMVAIIASMIANTKKKMKYEGCVSYSSHPFFEEEGEQ